MAAPFQLVGLMLGHYRIIEQIGAGGMGVVYRAHDEQLDRDVAIKVLPPGTLSDEATRRQFRKEALALGKLNHPNVETVFEFSLQDNVDFLAMELIAGSSLRERLQEGPLPEREIIRLSMQLAQGLAAAHEKGIVHRDLKPGNIMITPDGRVKILDFGLAKLIRPLPTTDATQESTVDASTISGTLPYMSPEQLRGQTVDPRSDIYAAGAVLYEMSTGRKPFPQSQSAELIGAILHTSPDPPSRRNRNVTPAFERVVQKALEKEPSRRYQTSRELSVALEALEEAPRGDSRITTGAAILALVLLLGLTFGFNLGRIRERLLRRLPAEGTGATPAPIKMRRSVAVFGFKNVSGRADAAWLSTGLSEMLTTELGAGEQLRTVAEENVARAKMDLSLSEADSLAGDTLVRVRKNLGADFVVLGSYIALGREGGGQVRVDLRLQDVRNGDTIGVVSETGTESKLFYLVTSAGKELRKKLGIGEISETDASSVRAALSADPDATRLYAEGLAKLRVFDALAARDILEKSVAADPKYAMAHSALAAAWSALGYDRKASQEAKNAVDLSSGLPREESLAIQGRSFEIDKNWPKAVEVYKTLWKFSPDNVDYDLHLAQVQSSASQAKDALTTIDVLRRLPAPDRDDPRIDLAEETADRGLSDFKRQLAVTQSAVQKGETQGARLLVARAKLAEARAFFSLGDPKNCRSASEQAQRIFVAAGDRNGEAIALHNIAAAMSEQGDNAGAQKIDQGALETCRIIGNKRCMADTLNSIGIRYKDQADFASARHAYEQSLALRRETGDRNGESVALSNLGVLLYQQGRLAEAGKMFEQSLAISRQTSEKRGTVRALTNLGIILRDQGRLAEARKMSEESPAIRREIGDKVGAGVALNNLAVLLIDQGDLTGAQKGTDEQNIIFREASNQRGMAYARFVEGEILLQEGKLEESRKVHEEALAIRTKMGEKTTVEESRLALSNLAIEQGRGSEAEQSAREVRDQSHSGKEPDLEIMAEMLLARCLLARGDPAEAKKALAKAEFVAESSENRLLKTNLTITVARVRAATGKLDNARASLLDALAAAKKMGCLRCEFEARLALGEIESKSAQTTETRSRLAALEKDATAKGFLLVARKAAAAAKNAAQTSVLRQFPSLKPSRAGNHRESAVGE
jgi:tetratricopeptide (TPR) repeat protein/tRNA A-37 threonylcarbamoyl transferase component Bud32/TolB-like protein